MHTPPPTGATPLALTPPLTSRQRISRQIKRLALEHGLTVSSVTSADAFPQVFAVLRDRIAAGHLAGMDWFTTERAAASCEPRTLMAEPRAILSVGIAYWGHDPGKPHDGVPRGQISRYARGIDYHDILPRRM